MPKVKRKTPIVENFCEAFGSLKDGEPLFVKNSPSKWAVKSYRRLIFSVKLSEKFQNNSLHQNYSFSG